MPDALNLKFQVCLKLAAVCQKQPSYEKGMAGKGILAMYRPVHSNRWWTKQKLELFKLEPLVSGQCCRRGQGGVAGQCRKHISTDICNDADICIC